MYPIKQHYDMARARTFVFIGNLRVPISDRLLLSVGKTPAEVALASFDLWISRYTEFVQQRFQRVL